MSEGAMGIQTFLAVPRATLTLPDVLGFDGETLRRCNDPECGNLQGLGVLQNTPTVARVGAVYP